MKDSDGVYVLDCDSNCYKGHRLLLRLAAYADIGVVNYLHRTRRRFLLYCILYRVYGWFSSKVVHAGL